MIVIIRGTNNRYVDLVFWIHALQLQRHIYCICTVQKKFLGPGHLLQPTSPVQFKIPEKHGKNNFEAQLKQSERM